MQEIEYKFLVDHSKWKQLDIGKPQRIVQGFITNTVDKVVRVRIKGKKGILTIKGKSEGITRTEFEYEIPLKDAEQLLDQFTDKYIEKDRYEIIHEGKKWEVDVFKGPLTGLILAELEVDSTEETFSIPEWVTKDVSTDPSYFNAILINQC